jgi:L-threonylcarbamoyladenylate synthase
VRVLDLRRDYRGSLDAAVEVLGKGGLVVYPTDTLYALGGDATDEKAVRKVFRAKKRPMDMPLPIAVADMRMLRRYARLHEEARILAERYLPGPLTLVLEKKDLPDVLTSGLRNVAVRIPANEAALELIGLLGKPVVTTSANFTGDPPPVRVEEVPPELGAEVALDQGVLGERVPSTIVGFDKGLRVIREGKISKEEILEALR